MDEQYRVFQNHSSDFIMQDIFNLQWLVWNHNYQPFLKRKPSSYFQLPVQWVAPRFTRAEERALIICSRNWNGRLNSRKNFSLFHAVLHILQLVLLRVLGYKKYHCLCAYFLPIDLHKLIMIRIDGAGYRHFKINPNRSSAQMNLDARA